MVNTKTVAQPANYIVGLGVSQQEHDDLRAFFYRMKDGQVTIAGLPADQVARVNNLAMPLYEIFDGPAAASSTP